MRLMETTRGMHGASAGLCEPIRTKIPATPLTNTTYARYAALRAVSTRHEGPATEPGSSSACAGLGGVAGQMLRRFEWIRDGGYFCDFRCDTSLPDFGRINVIYGNNGSGKSSLARVLDGLRSDADGYQKISIVLDDNGNRRVTDGHADPVFSRVLVFNEEYVARSHRFRDGNADMEAVLTLGQRTAEDEERLELLRAERQTLTEERAGLAARQSRIARDLEDTYGRVAQAVVDDASRAGGIYASRGNYSTARVKNRLRDLADQLVALQSGELAAKKHLISADNKDQLSASGFSLAARDGIAETAKRLLAITPVTIVLDTLQAHPEASAWVQQGAGLHQDLETCAFCGGPLSGTRKEQIEKHFSDNVAQLQRDLEDLDRELRKAESEAESIAQRVPACGLLFDDLRQHFDVETQAVRGQVAAFKQWCAELRAKLASKRDNVLIAVAYDLASPPTVDGAALAQIRDRHNQRVNEHAHLVQTAAKAVELHHLQSNQDRISDLLSRQSSASGRLMEVADRLEEIAREITGLESAEGDPTPSAQVLTREVARLLGRKEIQFEASGKRYRVLRNGSPATGLSVGERTAVTLVHFLEMVARFDAAAGKTIVVIDDPVSSLDTNVFMGISTYIWSAVVSTTKDHVDQLFLLTHNFELFRQWDIQLENLHKGRGMPALFPAELYELRSRHVTVAGTQRRRPALSKWPESPGARKKMRSSYHHAFLLMTKAHEALKKEDTVENRMDAQLLFPNLIRRVLESFLAFKHPDQTGDFTSAMRQTTAMLEAAGYGGNAEALRQQLTRYTHAYSHSESPDTNEAVNPDEIASALAAVFNFMQFLDEGHFRGLCRVVGVEPVHLVPPTADEGKPSRPPARERVST
jgi:wobble nucleotide-excising tRNase